jgi:hypothetical protein
VQDVEDEPLFTERVAGLDIAKAEVKVTIRVPSDTGTGRRQETRTFHTTRLSGSPAAELEGKMTSRWRAVAGAAMALAVTGLLSACAAAGAGETGLSSDTSIEMIAGVQTSSFYLSMECGAAQEARRLGINLTVVAPRASPPPISCPRSAA